VYQEREGVDRKKRGMGEQKMWVGESRALNHTTGSVRGVKMGRTLIRLCKEKGRNRGGERKHFCDRKKPDPF